MKPFVLKTWDEWESEGFHVIKGQKAVAYDIKSVALFSSDQVAKTVYHGYEYDPIRRLDVPTYTREPEPRVVYYADGSGYVEASGPSGPLYFDRDGNT